MRKTSIYSALSALITAALCLTGCASGFSGGASTPEGKEEAAREAACLSIIDDEPTTCDPQCTTEFYTIGLNIFDRLVEVNVREDGVSEIVPSLADSWEISDDGLVYTFHLHEGVRFSNGAELTSGDVLYTLKRLLTHPDACNQDIAEGILGAGELMRGETDTLAGFTEIDDLSFSIELAYPYAAFLACLSTPGASIFDEETTEMAGSKFGIDPAMTIGTGPFIYESFTPGSEIVLRANPDCWSGAPRSGGLILHLVNDTEAQRVMFENGELDILDMENLGSDAEYFLHGDIYRDMLAQGPRVGISYIALNADIKPLDDVRVRRALQLLTDRQTLLDAIYGGRGSVENGIFPHGLIGYNPDLPDIDYDVEEAKKLLALAGYPDGFSMTISSSDSSASTARAMLELTASMWEKAGVHAVIEDLDDETFMNRRKSGMLAAYTSTWSADYNDPDNFIYTFFGSRENTYGRSLCYGDEAVMERVRGARAIVDEEARLAEYRALEQKIVQEDAAWIPLFSRQHYYLLSRKVHGFKVSWNGWSSNKYRDVEKD